MKKVYLIVLAVVFSAVSALGQSTLTFPSGKTLDQKQNVKITAHQNYSKDANTRWYNYGETMDLILGGVGEYSANFVFPDSTMQVVYSGSVQAGTWIHKVADVFDPTVEFFNDPANYPGELNITKNSTYTLDSMQIYCIYMRGTAAPTATDTLLIEVKLGNFPGAFAYFGPTSAVSINLGTDTTMFIDLAYTQATNSFGYTADYTIKFPLTDAFAADTLDNGLNIIDIAPNLNIPANKLMYVSLSFVPGYTWTPNVSLMADYNSFRFLSMDEGAGHFPTYTKHDWNVSYILPQDVRYNAAGGWNGSYIPSFAYMGGTSNSYTYMHHAIYYKCTDPDASVQDNAAENVLANAYPNPVNGNSNMIIPVNTNDPNAVVTVSDMLGQEVMKFNKITNNQIIVNTSELKDGLYFYTLHSGKNTVTKKFTVVK